MIFIFLFILFKHVIRTVTHNNIENYKISIMDMDMYTSSFINDQYRPDTSIPLVHL